VPTLRDILDERVREASPVLYESWTTIGSAVSPADTAARFPKANPASAKCATTAAEKLFVPWGYTAGMQCDPIEKKPFFHAYPGALALQLRHAGCDLHCGYCQNWVHLTGAAGSRRVSPPVEASPESLVRDALDLGAKVIVSTYNEPLITASGRCSIQGSEVRGTSHRIRVERKRYTAGSRYLRPWLDLYKVDLKSFDDRHYTNSAAASVPSSRAFVAFIKADCGWRS